MNKPNNEAVVIHFTAEEVHDLLAVEIKRRHPELLGRTSGITAIVDGDDAFTGIAVDVDEAEGE